MKKILVMLLVLVMAVSMFAGCQKDNGTPVPTDDAVEAPVDGGDTGDEPTGDATPEEEGFEVFTRPADQGTTLQDTTLIVGTPEMNGDFIGGFGNSAYDLSIKTIVHGYYDTYVTTPAGEIALNTQVVKGLKTEEDEAGNKTYTFKLYDDLKWNDGSAMTAKDYVFGLLMAASPEWVTAGAASSAGEGLLGYRDYHYGYKTTTDEDGNVLAADADGNAIEVLDEEGNSNLEEIKDQLIPVTVFPGVSYIDDVTLSVTIDAAELPYFWETAYAAVGPTSLAVYAPGADVVTDENGSYIVADDLQALLNNVAATERFAPSIGCGPYKFISFENQTVTLEANEFFVGDLDGYKPQIKTLVQKSVPSDTDVDGVIAGDYDLVTGVIEGAKIEAAKAAETTELNSYLRCGYGMIAMHCDWGVTADPNVRWALACLIDRNEVINYVLGGYGGTVDAAYGLAQWTYEEQADYLDENLKPISFNVAEANNYLDQTEWKYEADGATPFDATKAAEDGSYMRYNDKGEMLVVRHLGTENNEVTDIIEIQYTKNAPLAGVKFEVTKSDFNALLANYYYSYDLGDDRYYNTFNLATNFGAVDDKYYSWHSDWLGTWYNANQLSDKTLDDLTMQMRKLDPTETEKFSELWAQFQVRWQELLPNIPLYSNEYFDVFDVNLKGVATTPYAGYADIVCQLHFAE